MDPERDPMTETEEVGVGNGDQGRAHTVEYVARAQNRRSRISVSTASRNHILREMAEKSGWWTQLEEMNANNMEANE